MVSSPHTVRKILRTTAFALLLSGINAPLQARTIDNYSPEKPAPQTDLGTITGRVTGNVTAINGATVVLLHNNELVDRVTTDKDGYFRFTYVNPGRYDIKAAKDGHRANILYAVPVNQYKTTTADFYLPVISNPNTSHQAIAEIYTPPKVYVDEVMRADNEVMLKRHSIECQMPSK